MKLVHDEPRSQALWAYLGTQSKMASSELVLAEVPRALRRIVVEERSQEPRALFERAEQLFETVVLLPVDRATLLDAGAQVEPNLRSLDAIHVVTALEVLPLAAFLTYDRRQAAAARVAGLPTVSPGAEGAGG